MKLFKYNQFLGETPLNENLDKAKKFLKDRFILSTAVKDLDLLTGELAAQMEHGEKRTLSLKDFTPEQQEELRKKIREIKITDDQIRNIERELDFVKLRELLKDNLGYLYNFTYMYFVEMVSFEEIKSMYDRVISYGQLLDKFLRKFV